MFVCPRCSADNPQYHRFCQQCGLKLVRRLAVVVKQPLEMGEPTDPQAAVPDGAAAGLLQSSRVAKYLGDRYQILDEPPVDISCHWRCYEVLDCHPETSTAVQAFIAQQPAITGKEYLTKSPLDYPDWELWERCGISVLARPYLALQPALAGLPPLWDAWDEPERMVVILDSLPPAVTVADLCQSSQSSDRELVDCLAQIVQLWIYFEPWQVRSTLLDGHNLGLTPESNLVVRLLLQEEQPVTLRQLVQSWQTLLGDRGAPWPEVFEGWLAAPDLTTDLLRTSLLDLIAPPTTGEVIEASDLTDFTDATDSLIANYALVGIEAAAITDVGQQRDHNEDYYSIQTTSQKYQSPAGQALAGRGLYILCDGMGGHAAGEVASRMASDRLCNYWDEHWTTHLPSEEEILRAIAYANQAVYEENQSSAAAGNSRMGTTLVMVMVQGNQVAIAHVGDSRCYLFEESSTAPVQVTTDHEVGQREILRGVEPEIAYGRPDAYQLTQAIGPRDWDSISPDVQFFGLRENTLILLASDGLTDHDLLETHGEELLRPLVERQVSLQAGVDNLIEFANTYNGHDNITAIAVHIQISN
jgi:protein phosphatase